jgi:hypothetical protein
VTWEDLSNKEAKTPAAPVIRIRNQVGPMLVLTEALNRILEAVADKDLRVNQEVDMEARVDAVNQVLRARDGVVLQIRMMRIWMYLIWKMKT